MLGPYLSLEGKCENHTKWTMEKEENYYYVKKGSLRREVLPPSAFSALHNPKQERRTEWWGNKKNQGQRGFSQPGRPGPRVPNIGIN